MRIRQYYLLLIFVLGLSSCGYQVPNMGLWGEKGLDEAVTEAALVWHIKCEIKLGVQGALDAFRQNPELVRGYSLNWLEAWVAKVTLKLIVDDTTSVNPAASLTKPLHNALSHYTSGNVTTKQMFSTGIGLQISGETTRTETIAFVFSIANLLKEGPKSDSIEDCDKIGHVPFLGTLKINDFIVEKSLLASNNGLLEHQGPKSPFSAFNDEVSFIFTLSGNVTPQWQLVRITANSTSPFFNDVRKRTQDVIVTLGPPGSALAGQIDSASVLGQAINQKQQ
jgi:hypothetical protein